MQGVAVVAGGGVAYNVSLTRAAGTFIVWTLLVFIHSGRASAALTPRRRVGTS